ncbi:ABC-three component system middle component 1 [Aliarcobacter cryaerophilus]|uniref:ABC-three component system middle component 1 n=1 Tax=Aliarcobacter cryaerophilus TaxID=28198 RepID=UPI000831F559|nr:ABC-three component system middle component 1 [Aliarcobacter cryaerophilus]
MLNIICDLFELYNYDKIDLEQGFLFSHPNDSEKKDFWIVIEEDDLSSVVLRQSDILNDCKIKYESNDLEKNASLLILWNTTGELELSEMKKLIMPIEENPYYFKKHVLYYSHSELEEFNSKLEDNNLSDFFSSNITNEETFRDYKENPLQGSWRELFYRVTIKLPFINININTSSNIESLQHIINNKLENNNDNRLIHLNNHFFELYEDLTIEQVGSKEPSEIIDSLFEITEGDTDGN